MKRLRLRYLGLAWGLLCNGALGALSMSYMAGAVDRVQGLATAMLITLLGVVFGSLVSAWDVRQAHLGDGRLPMAYAGVLLCLLLPFHLGFLLYSVR